MNTNFNTKKTEKHEAREALQDLFDASFLKMDLRSLRTSYQRLRELELKSTIQFTTENVAISSLVENITIACDIICSENEKNFIYCGNDTSIARANQRLITKAVLNLLSNAFLYSQSKLVTVKTIEKRDFISVEIQNAGALPQDFAFGDGLNFVQGTCCALKGHFFISSDQLSVKVVMLIPKSQSIQSVNPSPDFSEFLSDRLSPVYVEFFGIE